MPDMADTFAGVFGSEPWVWKDPRTCLTFPLWRRVLGPSVRVVLVLRAPGAVVSSLKRRDGIPTLYGTGLWHHYVHAAVQSSQGLPLVCVHFDDLVASPARHHRARGRRSGRPGGRPRWRRGGRGRLGAGPARPRRGTHRCGTASHGIHGGGAGHRSPLEREFPAPPVVGAALGASRAVRVPRPRGPCGPGTAIPSPRCAPARPATADDRPGTVGAPVGQTWASGHPRPRHAPQRHLGRHPPGQRPGAGPVPPRGHGARPVEPERALGEPLAHAPQRQPPAPDGQDVVVPAARRRRLRRRWRRR